jgi:hypothetical protein
MKPIDGYFLIKPEELSTHPMRKLLTLAQNLAGPVEAFLLRRVEEAGYGCTCACRGAADLDLVR